MDTNKLKKFATEARTVLNQGVAQRFITLGFNPDGTVTEEPVERGGGATFMGDVVSLDFYKKWMSLKHAVDTKGITEVVEEAAYTWFNRMMAIRIMVKNNLISPVLEYESDDVRVPLIVAEARQGRYPNMDEQTREKLLDLLDDDSKTNDQFRMLIVAYCHSNPIINKCFGGISDYTELLLPTNILAEGGFVDLLNSTPFISDEDFHSPELIGWLYQFYISEKKDDVFASFKKGRKAEAKDIPAATQIFTPNWIVKYMVQNTVGRIYLDNNPYSGIKEDMRYLVEPSDKPSADSIFKFDDIHDLTCADLACGSGHILNEAFDLLYQIYLEEGYNRRKAVEDIFKYNLTGIDLDTRAKQLAQFALLMKACQKDSSFADAHIMPRVYDMPEPYPHKETLRDTLPHFFMGGNQEMIAETIEAIELMDNAQNYGSIMKFNISERTRNAIAVRVEEYENDSIVPSDISDLLPYMRIILALTQKYSALCMNPPYMGAGNMNAALSQYVRDNYPDGKADLFSVFMYVAEDRLTDCGLYGMINMQSWMFLSSFENLRKHVLESTVIENMLHLGPRTFDELSGEVVQNTAFVIRNTKPCASTYGAYYRLVEGKDCADKERLFNENGAKIFYPSIPQSNFEKIPGSPIGYWVSEKMIEAFAFTTLDKIAEPKAGLATGDNPRFQRLWGEVSIGNIRRNTTDVAETINAPEKWYPCLSGGLSRKWADCIEYVVDWQNDGYNLKHFRNSSGRIASRPQNTKYYFKKGLTWNKISSNHFLVKLKEVGSIFDDTSRCAFVEDNINLHYLVGLLCSNLSEMFLKFFNPTMSFTNGDISRLPIKYVDNSGIDNLVLDNIAISRLDWDSHETSWDFKRNPIYEEQLQLFVYVVADVMPVLTVDDIKDYNLPALLQPLPILVENYKSKWEDLFYKLHHNEEELNRQFIEIYGLQDELTPDVPLNEITILQQGEITIENNALKWNDDVIIKQLISYAIGCMMGRYSIDKPGLILANQGDGLDEYNTLVPNSRFEPDDDGIIPMMSADTEFTDNAPLRLKTWLTTVFGADSLVENLNYIEKCLGKSIEDYFVKDFWADHKKMYSNRPIYWLFRSKKGAFQCIAYMHRMNPYTAEAIRTKYLLPHIEWLVNQKNEFQANAANLSTRERRQLDTIIKQIDECREYHDRLHVIADQQIAFDLDDGVLVNYAKFGDVLQKLK